MSEEDGITHIDIEQNDLLDDLPDEYLGADELPLEAIDLGDEVAEEALGVVDVVSHPKGSYEQVERDFGNTLRSFLDLPRPPGSDSSFLATRMSFFKRQAQVFDPSLFPILYGDKLGDRDFELLDVYFRYFKAIDKVTFSGLYPVGGMPVVFPLYVSPEVSAYFATRGYEDLQPGDISYGSALSISAEFDPAFSSLEPKDAWNVYTCVEQKLWIIARDLDALKATTEFGGFFHALRKCLVQIDDLREYGFCDVEASNLEGLLNFIGKSRSTGVSKLFEGIPKVTNVRINEEMFAYNVFQTFTKVFQASGLTPDMDLNSTMRDLAPDDVKLYNELLNFLVEILDKDESEVERHPMQDTVDSWMPLCDPAMNFIADCDLEMIDFGLRTVGEAEELFSGLGFIDDSLRADIATYRRELEFARSIVGTDQAYRHGLPVNFPQLCNRETFAFLASNQSVYTDFNPSKFASLACRLRFKDGFADLDPEESYKVFEVANRNLYNFSLILSRLPDVRDAQGFRGCLALLMHSLIGAGGAVDLADFRGVFNPLAFGWSNDAAADFDLKGGDRVVEFSLNEEILIFNLMMALQSFLSKVGLLVILDEDDDELLVDLLFDESYRQVIFRNLRDLLSREEGTTPALRGFFADLERIADKLLVKGDSEDGEVEPEGHRYAHLFPHMSEVSNTDINVLRVGSVSALRRISTKIEKQRDFLRANRWLRPDLDHFLQQLEKEVEQCKEMNLQGLAAVPGYLANFPYFFRNVSQEALPNSVNVRLSALERSVFHVLRLDHAEELEDEDYKACSDRLNDKMFLATCNLREIALSESLGSVFYYFCQMFSNIFSARAEAGVLPTGHKFIEIMEILTANGLIDDVSWTEPKEPCMEFAIEDEILAFALVHNLALFLGMDMTYVRDLDDPELRAQVFDGLRAKCLAISGVGNGVGVLLQREGERNRFFKSAVMMKCFSLLEEMISQFVELEEGGILVVAEDGGTVMVDALVPPEYAKPEEQVDYNYFRKFVAGKWRFNKSQQVKKRKGWQDKTARDKYACEMEASISVGGLEDDIKVRHLHVRSIFIRRRDYERVVSQSNWECNGAIRLRGPKKGKQREKEVLQWRMDERGELFFVIGEETYSYEDLKGPQEQNFYLEMKSMIFEKLSDLLVKRAGEVKEARWKQNAGDVVELSDREEVEIAKGRKLRPRYEKLLDISDKGRGSESGESGSVVAREALKYLKKIENAEDITREELEHELEGIVLYRKVKEVQLVESRKETVYLPFDSYELLWAIADKKQPEINLDNVYVVASRDRPGRGGYNPFPRGETLECKQRTPSEYSVAVRDLLENEYKVRFTRGASDFTSIRIPEVDGERVKLPIEKITIGTVGDFEAGAEDNITIGEIRSWVRRELDDVSATSKERIASVVIANEQGERLIVPNLEDDVDISDFVHFRVHKVLLRAPQNVQFTRGIYRSLAEFA
jgi:hypothetical protein